jgi:hypothetical protein
MVQRGHNTAAGRDHLALGLQRYKPITWSLLGSRCRVVLRWHETRREGLEIVASADGA